MHGGNLSNGLKTNGRTAALRPAAMLVCLLWQTVPRPNLRRPRPRLLGHLLDSKVANPHFSLRTGEMGYPRPILPRPANTFLATRVGTLPSPTFVGCSGR